VYGEVRFGGKLDQINSSIQECSDAKVQAATLSAGDAQQSANAVAAIAKDLLGKYTSAERELTELKAERMPRRLSSAQAAKLRQRVVTFSIKTIHVECINGGQEAFDFEHDFVVAFSTPDSPVKLDFWLISCNMEMGPNPRTNRNRGWLGKARRCTNLAQCPCCDRNQAEGD
jgi:hypothetical protein